MSAVGVVIFGAVLIFVGIQGFLHPDPTPEPALRPGPAQFIAFALMILVGVAIEVFAVWSLIQYRREVRRVRDEHRDE